MKLVPFEGELDPIPEGTALFDGELDEEKNADWGTAIKQKLAEAGNMADAAISLPAGALASIFSTEEGDRIFREMDARRAANLARANPDRLPLSTAQQIGGTLATLPAQIPAMLGAAAEKGMDLVNRGEPLSTAIPATLVEGGLTAAGLGPMAPAKTFVGRATIGAGANVATGMGSDAATQLLATQESTKEAYNPYDLNKRIVEGVTGGVLQGKFGDRPDTKNTTLNNIRAEAAAKEAAKAAEPASGTTADMRGADIAGYDQVLREPGSFNPYDVGGYVSKSKRGVETTIDPEAQRTLFDEEISPTDVPRMEQPDLFSTEPPKPFELTAPEGDVPPMPPREVIKTRLDDPMLLKRTPDGGLGEVRPTEPQTLAPTTRESASEKVANGQQFAMTAEERIYWEKTRKVIQEISDGTKTLSNKEILNKIMDREWVQNTIDKIKQRTEMFREIEQRSQDHQAVKMAEKRREVLEDQLTALQEHLSAPRPDTSRAQQGPKTRAAKSKTYLNLNSGIPLHMDDIRAIISDVREMASFVKGLFDSGYTNYTKALTRAKELLGDAWSKVKDSFKDHWDTTLKEKGNKSTLNFDKKDPDLTKIDNALSVSEDGTYIPNNPDTKVAIEKALEQGKDGKQWTYVQSGSTSVAMKSGSPIIKAASEIVQNALKRADLLIRNSIFPAEQRIKNLSRDDITTLAEVFKDEMKLGKRYDGDILANNFSVKQIEAYTEMRRMFDDALDAQNAARLAKGQDPIKPMEAYMASRWQGDFRRPIYEYVKNKDGSFKLNEDGSKAQKLVWYLADNTRGGLEKQTKALKRDFPDLIVDPKKDHVVRSSSTKTELDSMYTRMLDILGRDDPAIQKIQQAIADQEMIRGAGALGQEKHFEKKAGIRGFVGDRPGTNPRQEAIAMFQQQIQYAKNAYRWSELQKAADDIKAITSDPRLQEQQPNNIKYIREYFKNAVGMGESRMARAFDDSLRDGMGVSPTIINNAVGDIKSFFILQKLAASAGYTIANMVQTSNVIPYLAQMAGAGYRGNPVTAVLAGSLQGMAMGAWHYARALDPTAKMPLPDQFMRDAFAYAEDNGVIARSVYDESPIESSFGIVGGAANLAAKTMTIPESFVRSVAFMSYANMLKSSGKFTDNSKLFQMAEEYVNKSMVDYRETERPLMFAKAGAAGNFANTLQTYPISFYNQYAYMAKQAMEGNPWGLGAMLAVHYGVAGLMGIPGFDDTDKIYKWLRDNTLPTGKWGYGDILPGWADVMDSPFMSDPKLWLMENAGKSAVYGALSENTGLGLTSRVAAPGAGAMLQSPAGPITDIAGQAWNVAKLAVDPTDKDKQAQVAMSSLPVGLQGLFETSDFMKEYDGTTRPDGTKVYVKNKDIADRKGSYARTPEEVQMRKFGLRSQKEVVERDVSYATTSALQTQAKKSGELIDRFYSAVRQGDKEQAQKLNRLYIQLTGKEDGIRDVDIENQIKEEFMTDVERSKSAINTVNKAKAIARMNAILEKR